MPTYHPAPTTLSRRAALKSAAAAAPVLLANPARALQPTASDRVTVGIIGCGIRARNLSRSWSANPRLRVVAVCDVDTTRRDDLQQRYHDAYGSTDIATYLDYRELLQHDDLDAVGIFTPDHWHATQLIDAANAKKHIYCEKPLTHTLLESQRCIDAVRANGVTMQTGSQQRSEYGHRFVTAAEYVANERLGTVRQAFGGVGPASRACNLPEEDAEPGLDWDLWQGPVPTRPYNSVLAPRGVHSHYPLWRNYREYAGGSLADFGAHHFDIAQWALGLDTTSPTHIQPPTNRRDTRGAVATFADGRQIIHGGQSGTTFVGDSGVIRVDRPVLQAIPADLFDTPLPDDATAFPRHRSHLDNWLDCIDSGDDPVAPIEAGARTAALCHLLAIAYWTGQPLNFDPDTWRFTNDDALNDWLDYDRRDGYALPLTNA